MKILFNSLRDLKNEIITLKSYLKQVNVSPHPTQLYLVSIRFRRKICFVTTFTIDLKSTINGHKCPFY